MSSPDHQPQAPVEASKPRPINPFALPRIKRREGSRTFIDPNYPDFPVHIRVRELDGIEISRALDRAQNWIEEFITGNEAKGLKPSPPLLPGETKLPNLSVRILQNIAYLEVMQEAAGISNLEEEGYDLLRCLGLARHMPSVWMQIVGWASEYMPKIGDTTSGNSPSSSTEK